MADGMDQALIAMTSDRLVISPLLSFLSLYLSVSICVSLISIAQDRSSLSETFCILYFQY